MNCVNPKQHILGSTHFAGLIVSIHSYLGIAMKCHSIMMSRRFGSPICPSATLRATVGSKTPNESPRGQESKKKKK
ncbi:hypothetical protein DL98DRAFT_224331 [Cadophora sp. DSE1049]|nr:hypothetical protein DL98DRAFT_224331 [Cadophora sp. DSE1049]